MLYYAHEPHVENLYYTYTMCECIATRPRMPNAVTTQLLKKLFIFDNNLDMLLSFRFARSPILCYIHFVYIENVHCLVHQRQTGAYSMYMYSQADKYSIYGGYKREH